MFGYFMSSRLPSGNQDNVEKSVQTDEIQLDLRLEDNEKDIHSFLENVVSLSTDLDEFVKEISKSKESLSNREDLSKKAFDSFSILKSKYDSLSELIDYDGLMKEKDAASKIEEFVIEYSEYLCNKSDYSEKQLKFIERLREPAKKKFLNVLEQTNSINDLQYTKKDVIKAASSNRCFDRKCCCKELQMIFIETIENKIISIMNMKGKSPFIAAIDSSCQSQFCPLRESFKENINNEKTNTSNYQMVDVDIKFPEISIDFLNIKVSVSCEQDLNINYLYCEVDGIRVQLTDIQRESLYIPYLTYISSIIDGNFENCNYFANIIGSVLLIHADTLIEQMIEIKKKKCTIDEPDFIKNIRDSATKIIDDVDSPLPKNGKQFIDEVIDFNRSNLEGNQLFIFERVLNDVNTRHVLLGVEKIIDMVIETRSKNCDKETTLPEVIVEDVNDSSDSSDSSYN